MQHTHKHVSSDTSASRCTFLLSVLHCLEHKQHIVSLATFHCFRMDQQQSRGIVFICQNGKHSMTRTIPSKQLDLTTCPNCIQETLSNDTSFLQVGSKSHPQLLHLRLHNIAPFGIAISNLLQPGTCRSSWLNFKVTFLNHEPFVHHFLSRNLCVVSWTCLKIALWSRTDFWMSEENALR